MNGYKFGPISFTAAIDWAARRGVVMPDVYYGNVQSIQRALTFTVSRLVSLSQIEHVKKLADKALKEGTTYRDFANGVTGEAEKLTPNHLETVFRNYLQNSYSAGRYQRQMSDPGRPVFFYDAVNDSRTRPEHQAMDGFMALRSNPVWRTWYPPNGHNCRCSVTAMTEAQAYGYGWKGPGKEGVPEVEPDPGWDYAPGDAYRDRIKQVVAGYKETAPKAVEETVRAVDAGDPDKWVEIPNTQKGSNPGGIYEAADGQRYYVKFPRNPGQAKAEVASANVARLLNLETLEPEVVVIGGKTGVATRWVDGLRKLTKKERSNPGARLSDELARAHQSAILTKNWDVVGLEYDNLLVNKDGRIVIADTGGSFRFRAQGDPKPFGGDIAERSSLLDAKTNSQAAQVFRAAYARDVWREQRAGRIAAGVDDEALRQALVAAGLGDDQELVDSLLARRRALAKLYDADGSRSYEGFGRHIEAFKKWGVAAYEATEDSRLTGGTFSKEARYDTAVNLIPKFEEYLEKETGVSPSVVREIFADWSGSSNSVAGGAVKMWSHDRFDVDIGMHNYEFGEDALKEAKRHLRTATIRHDITIEDLFKVLDIEYEFNQYYLRRIHGWETVQVRREMSRDEFSSAYNELGPEGGTYTPNAASSTQIHKGRFTNVKAVYMDVPVDRFMKTWLQGPEYMKYQGIIDDPRLNGRFSYEGNGSYEFEYLMLGGEKVPAKPYK